MWLMRFLLLDEGHDVQVRGAIYFCQRFAADAIVARLLPNCVEVAS